MRKKPWRDYTLLVGKELEYPLKLLVNDAENTYPADYEIGKHKPQRRAWLAHFIWKNRRRFKVDLFEGVYEFYYIREGTQT